MKILAIKIDGFGKWVNVNWSIDSHLQAIYGPNEAGKSTLVEFVLSVLFSFANSRGKNKYRRYIPRDTDAYGGALLVEHQGQKYWINRSKGSRGGKVTITDENGKASKVTLHELLGPLNLDLVRNVFYFDQGELSTVNDVTDDQLRQNLQQVGAVGSMRWQQKKDELNRQAKKLYGARANTRPLNLALQEVSRLNDQLTAAQQNNQQYLQFQQELGDNKVRLQDLHEKVQQAQDEQAEAVRLQRLWPVYQQWQAATASVKQERQASDDDVIKVQRLRTSEPELKKSIATKQQQLGQVEGQLQQINQEKVESYAAHWRDNNDPRPLLKKVQADALAHQRQADKAKKDRAELDQLEQRYGHPLPDPLNKGELQQLQSLLQHRDSRESGTKNISAATIIPGLGFLILLGGFATSHVVVTIIGLIAMLAGGYLLYRQSKQKQSLANNQEALDQFGRDHDLDKFPADSWLALQGDLRHGHDLAQAVSSYEEEGQHLAELREHWSGRFASFNVASTDNFWQQLINNLDRLEQSYQKYSQLQSDTKRARQDLEESRQRLQKAEQEKMAVYHRLNVADDQSFDDYLKQRTAAIKNGAQVEATSSQLKPADRQALQALGSSQVVDQNVLQKQNQLSQLLAQQNQLTTRNESVKVQIQHLVKDGTVTELEQQLANAQAKVNQLLQEYLTLRLTEQWINRSLEKASADRYPLILKRAVDYFKLLTDDHYQNIDFDDKGNLTVISTDRQQFNINELSTGTAEQLYVALRLGFIKVMSDTIEFPLIIDDGFVNFDRIRKQKMIELLKSMAQTGQVIYLTADDRICDSSDEISVINLAEADEGNLKES